MGRFFIIVMTIILMVSICIPVATLSEGKHDISSGDIVIFGHYEQDNNIANGKEDVEWIVLEIDENNHRALLISRYILDCERYNNIYTDITWETCDLRRGLNSNFLESAFSEEEQSAILTTTVDNSKNQGYDWTSATGGNDTKDKIFLLSYHEAFHVYFDNDNERMCVPTDYALAQGVDVYETSYQVEGRSAGEWWLRSPADCQEYAIDVHNSGLNTNTNVNHNYIGVRPALWVNLDSMFFSIKEDLRYAPERDGEPSDSRVLPEVGQIVTFGCYEQDNNRTNGMEPIEWMVLETDAVSHTVLLLSKYALDCKPYNAGQENVTWETCSLRMWLNNDFLNTAFTEGEQSMIVTTMVDNSHHQGFNKWTTPTDENDTLDKIFLLSYNETYNVYFNNDSARVCAPTDYALAQGAYTYGSRYQVDEREAGEWWLRSPGIFQYHAMYVFFDGHDELGYAVNVNNDRIGVRPVLRVDLDTEVLFPDKSVADSDEADTHYSDTVPLPYESQTVFFGSYEQDNNLINGTEPIEWIILDTDEANHKALLLSKYVLECKPYNLSFSTAIWETSTLRAWLNSDFLKTAFSLEEQSAILTTVVENNLVQGYAEYNPIVGNDTLDKIFLLSYNESFNVYFSSYDLRKCIATDYVLAEGILTPYTEKQTDGHSPVPWWLRSPSSTDGYAIAVNRSGVRGSFHVNYDYVGVRPAIWISLNSELTATAEDPSDIGLAADDEILLMTEEECQAVFDALDQYLLTASSGAGAWGGEMRIRSDCSFTGYYYDSDDDVTHEVSFSGNFALYGIERWGETTYGLYVENVQTQQTPGTEALSEYGDRIIYDWPPFGEHDYIRLTMPGTPDEEIPEMVRGEIGGTDGVWEDYSSYITLTTSDGWGFFADVTNPQESSLVPLPPTDELPSVDWTGIWAGNNPFSAPRLYIWHSESGGYQMALTLNMYGQERAIFGYLDAVDGITMEYSSDGNLHAGLALDPDGGIISLTVFSCVAEDWKPWIDKISVTYEYAGSLTDPASQLPASVRNLPGLDGLPWPASSVPSAPSDDRILADDEIITIVNLGKEMRDKSLRTGGPHAVYRLAVTNHLNQDIHLCSEHITDPYINSTVDGYELASLDLLGSGLNPLIPAGKTIELIMIPYGYGYGFESIDELVNVTAYVSVQDAQDRSQGRDYTLRLDEGKTYDRKPASGYMTHEATPYGFTFELPDDWRIMFNPTDFPGYYPRQYPEGYVWDWEWDLIHVLPPPTHSITMAIRSRRQEHISLVSQSGGEDYQISEMMIDGHRTIVYECMHRGMFSNEISSFGHAYYFINVGHEWAVEIFMDGSFRVHDQEIIDHFLNSIHFTSDGAPEAGQCPAFTELPKPTQSPTPAPADYSSWTGTWMTLDDSYAEMIITDNGDGTLAAHTLFLLTGDSEAVLIPQADGSMRFETQYGNLIGDLVPQEDGALLLTMTGGTTMEDEEATEYQGYYARGFLYYPAAYEDMWYQTPADASGPEDDWLGTWTSTTSGMSSSLHLRDENGAIRVDAVFGPYRFSGIAEPDGDSVLDVYSDDFWGMLILNRKLKRIALLEPAFLLQDPYDLFGDAFYGVLMYQPISKGTGTPDSAQTGSILSPAEQESLTGMPAIPAAAPETDHAFLQPVPDHPGYLQVPVARVDATSYIQAKNNPEAFIPERMIDGEETTSFQFSTKRTPLGKAYIYFEFDVPVTLDELWMKNGFWKITDGKDQYIRNSRVRKMTLDVRYAGETGYQMLKTVSLKDDKKRTSWKVIDLMHVQNVTAIRIRIDSIFKGSKYPTDVCISEIMFVQSEGQ